MTCKEFTEFLDSYLSEEISPAERAEFEQHLAICVQCVAYLATYKQAVAMGKAALEKPDGDVPSDVPEELVRAILAARKKA